MRIGVVQNACGADRLNGFAELGNADVFTISPDKLSFHEIFDSAFSTPARYILEIFRRLSHENGSTDGILIFNPMLELPPLVIGTATHRLDVSARQPFVIADSMNRPIAYYIPDGMDQADHRYLTLLSTVNAEVDRDLLNTLFDCNGHCLTIDVSVREYAGNGFMHSDELWFIYEYLARRAQDLLTRVARIKKGSGAIHSCRNEMFPSNTRALRDGIRLYAIMTHHAGDALFYAMAAEQTPHSHIDGIVVNRRYVHILDRVLPNYSRIPIDQTPPYRDGAKVMQSEESHFLGFAQELPPFGLYYFLRPSRDYNNTEFHFADHFAFALGQSFISSAGLVSRTRKSPDVRLTSNSAPFRILLHFDAGWGLKVYPKKSQEELISRLLSAGMQVTVLGSEVRDFGRYRSVTFRDLGALQELLHSHHLLVGSDSFPCHFATHIVGLPTICLFGPTKPVNSDALPSVHYRALERGLSCKPCKKLEECPLNGKICCNNMVSAETVQMEIETMLSSLYQ